MSGERRLLLLAPATRDLSGWQNSLGRLGEITRVADLAVARAAMQASTPDLLLVDVELVETLGAALSLRALTAVRGMRPKTLLYALGAAPDPTALRAYINGGGLAGFVAYDADPDVFAREVETTWALRHPPARSSLAEIEVTRRTLLTAQARAEAELAAQQGSLERALRASSEGRGRLDTVIHAGPSGALSFDALRVRLREEIEKHHRFGHPVSVVQMRLSARQSSDTTAGRALGHAVTRALGAVRHIDRVAAWEPDRVVVLLPVTPAERAQGVAARVHEALDSADLPLRVAEAEVLSYPADAERLLAWR